MTHKTNFGIFLSSFVSTNLQILDSLKYLLILYMCNPSGIQSDRKRIIKKQIIISDNTKEVTEFDPFF